MSKRILLVNSDCLGSSSLSALLTQEDCECVYAEDSARAVREAKTQSVDLVLLNVSPADGPGTGALQNMRAALPNLPVIVISANSTVDSAVQSMKLGARDFLTVPLDPDRLLRSERSALHHRSTAPSPAEGHKFGLRNLLGNSPVMREVKLMARKLADTDATTIMLLGETGTGKDMLARAIHYDSARVDRPFMNITCTALPDSLLDSELFGYEEGAFTDARRQKKGLFELANGGTVLLDEIGDMSAELQGKLLRVIEEKAFKRIGGSEDISVNVRIIAATHRDLEKAIENGMFREDLFYRLSIIPILLPPLRQRREDIPMLASHFLRMACQEHHRPPKELTPATLDRLTAQEWPGNIRQLRNVIERTALLSNKEQIEPDDLELGPHPGSDRPARKKYAVVLPEQGCDMEEIEQQLLLQALERTSWNQSRAAPLLNMTRDQVRYKMEKFHLKKPGAGKR